MRVSDAVREFVEPASVLYTSGKGVPFKVGSIDRHKLRLNGRPYILLHALDGVPAYMAEHGGRMKIGATHAAQRCTEQGTLEWYLKEAHSSGTSRASYVAPILARAGVIEILPKLGGEPQRIQLKDAWWPSA